MSNTILTPTAVTREAARIAHEKLSFIGTVSRQYDNQFAQSGGKIGSSLRVRMPNQYSVRTGATISSYGDTEENYETVTMATQKGVDVNFTSAELTLSLDDFSKRILEPAISTLVSVVEADMLSSVTKEVYNSVGTAGTTPSTYATVLAARTKLNQLLTPKDSQRAIQFDSTASAAILDNLKGLLNPAQSLSNQYLEGRLGGLAGFDAYENERVYNHTTGSDHTGITINSATMAEGATTIAITGASAAPAVGTTFTIAGVYAIHPETKVAYPFLKQFVVASGTTTSSLAFTPAFYTTAHTAPGRANASAVPATTAAIVFEGTASTTYPQHIAYHKDAFTFVTADLEDVGRYGAWGAREVMDGLSIRVARQYDIANDTFPCRIDILHGYKATRAQFATKITG